MKTLLTTLSLFMLLGAAARAADGQKFSAYPNTGTLQSGDLFILSRSGGGTFNIDAHSQLPGALGLGTAAYTDATAYDPVNSALAVQAALTATNATIQAQLQASNTVYRAAFEVAGAANAATNSLYSTLNAKKVDAANGVASNLTVSADATQFSAPNQAAMMVVLTGTNINGMNVSALSSTNELTAAGYHAFIANTNGNGGVAFDMAGWSPAFGSGYGGTVGLDIYNTNAARSSATSNLAPNFVVSYTDGRDSGIVTHHSILGINATNLNFELYYYTNASSERIPGFKWDPTIGAMPFRSSAKVLTGSGTVSGSGSTITGVGTKFGNTIFSEAGYGDAIAVGNNNYLIRSVNSGTSVTVQGTISPTFSGSNYSIFKGAVTWLRVDGTAISLIGGDGSPIFGHGSSDLAWVRLWGSTKDYYLGEGGSGEFLIHNATDNSNPFLMTGAGAITATSFSGSGAALTSLNASQLTSGNMASARLGTNDASASDGWVLSRSGPNQKWIAASGSGTVTSVGLTMPGEFTVSSSPVTGAGTLAVTRSADANFLGFGGTNVSYWKVGGTAAADTMTVTNGITNLSLTASTLLKADANKKISSIANGAGVLTNDASGNFGYAPLLSASALGASQYVATDANTNLVSTLNGNNWTNLVAYTHEGTTTNLTITFNGTLQSFTCTNGPSVGQNYFIHFAGANGSASIRFVGSSYNNLNFDYQPTWLFGSNNVITNGVVSFTSYGGTNAAQIVAAMKEKQ